MKLHFKKTLPALASILLIATHSTQAQETTANTLRIDIPGYVVHGINNYNGELIADFSGVSPGVPYLNTYPPVDEIGVYAQGFTTAGTITATTDRTLPVATTRSFMDFFNPEGEVDPATINIPLSQVGSNYLSPEFTSLDKRIVPTSFHDAGSTPTVHRKKGTVINPTVGEWEQISGKLSVATGRNGKSTVFITIRNAFPDAVYTLWDLGTLNPLSNEESGYAVPLGGLPNVVVTNSEGCAFAKLKLNYDLTQACEQGAAYCSNYVSAFYNWDAQTYGASAAATWAKAPTGVYGANQMIWPLSGELLIKPQTTFTPDRHGCDN